jgi:hypothetical protein
LRYERSAKGEEGPAEREEEEGEDEGEEKREEIKVRTGSRVHVRAKKPVEHTEKAPTRARAAEP